MRRLGPPLLLSFVFSLLVAAPARAQVVEPWADDDGIAGPTRHEFGDYGLQVGAEYRANWLYVNPVDLNGVKHRRASWVEHRLRLDATVDYDEKVRLVMSFDGLDGTLWGDNGTFGQSPSPNSGTRVAATNPNNAKPGVGYVGGDELDPDSYGYVLVPSDSFKLRRAYGEVVTPVGLLRIGRQPTTEGMSILVADGDGRTNRFGYSNAGDTTDRVLFVTKPLEGFLLTRKTSYGTNFWMLPLQFCDELPTICGHSTLRSVRMPAGTIYIVETKEYGTSDHVHPAWWYWPNDSGTYIEPEKELAMTWHTGGTNYTFVDGHAKWFRFSQVWSGDGKIDLFDPRRE